MSDEGAFQFYGKPHGITLKATSSPLGTIAVECGLPDPPLTRKLTRNQ
ncbi:MAG: hypothetical protein MUO76_12645 [Anaerolineaceae bacterium]|nr:hypothetical protein [Anaerolineaceae bacterium]